VTNRLYSHGAKPLKAESQTWQWGEINSQVLERSKPSRTCKTSRTEQREGWGFHDDRRKFVGLTLQEDVAIGNETLEGALNARRVSAVHSRQVGLGLFEEDWRDSRMNPELQSAGGRR
jgi:hypothetical protein